MDIGFNNQKNFGRLAKLSNKSSWSESRELLNDYILQFIYLINVKDLDEDRDMYLSLTAQAINHIINKLSLSNVIGPISPNSKIFGLLNKGGLANRIRALVSILVISEIIGVKSKFLWVSDPYCPALFNDLFLDTHLASVLSPENSIEFIEEYRSREALTEPHYFFNDVSSPWVFYANFIQHMGISWDNFHNSYISKLRLLFENVNPHIKNISEELLAGVGDKTLLGVHIRGTDFKRHYEITYPDRRLSEPCDFVSHINNYYSSYDLLYVSVDDSNYLADFENAYSDKLIAHAPNLQFINAVRHSSVQDAIVDMLCLSKTKQILGTYGSSFSEMASDIGSVPRDLI
jgi:hypothetical protein